MTWINKTQKSVVTSAKIFNIDQSTSVENITVNGNTLSTDRANQKLLVAEIFSAPNLGYGNHVDPYSTAPFITISTALSGKTYYNQSYLIQVKNLQTKTNLIYSKIEKDNPQTKTITAVNGATTVPDLITRLIMRVTQ